MRLRLRVAPALALGSLVGLVAACGFGVDLDNLFGDPSGPAPGDGGGLDGTSPEGSIPKVQVTHLAAAEHATCGRRADGTIMCWGWNGLNGRLGDGQPWSSSAPVLVREITDAVDVSAGPNFLCAARASGAVSCWGNNDTRQIGDGSTTVTRTPRTVLVLEGAARVSAGGGFACALRRDGSVWCWGDNGDAQLGDGTQTTRSQPAAVVGLAGATQIATARSTACALDGAGEVWCWGANNYGQAGQPASPRVAAPTKIPGLGGVTALASSGVANHFCAVRGAGEVRCWGYGGTGGLGNARSTSSDVPVVVVSVDDAVSVGVGDGFACAARRSGAVNCWGTNSWRQLGVGDAAPPDGTSSPLPVTGVTGAQLVTAGRAHTCALGADGQALSCWGGNQHGALGRGTRVLADVPVKASIPAGAKQVALGGNHGCAVDAAGGVSCWGSNDLRQLGNTTSLATGTPTPVPGVTGVTRAGLGMEHSCVVGAAGVVSCWGRGSYGAFGHGAAPYIQSTPVTFAAASPGVDVAAGASYSCAGLDTGQVACSGAFALGRLGTPSATTDRSTPVTVAQGPVDPDAGVETPLAAVTRLSIGVDHACVLHDGGKVACWGNSSDGECGVSAASGQSSALDVPLPSAAIDVAVGSNHTCVVLADGSVRCWGANGSGQLGVSSGSGTAQRVVDLRGKSAKAITAAVAHTCALFTDGTVGCWGRGTNGELGGGVRSDSTTVVAVKDLAKATAISAKDSTTCAVLEDASVWCWGTNAFGNLGDGTVMTTGVAAPVAGY
jgi:alpha-tubulin suppressor-like RCC1 family protein